MNMIWLLIMIITIVYCFITGKIDILNQVFMSIGKDTLTFVIPLLCVTVFWNGIFSIAKEAGILNMLQRILHPLLKRLFPDLCEDEETLGYIAANVVVNVMGMGSAATPVGLKAMEGMQKHNEQKDTATRSMVTFLVLNTAGVTIFSTTLIAIRASFHSNDVTSFMPYAILSTCFACIVGVSYDHWRNYRD